MGEATIGLDNREQSIIELALNLLSKLRRDKKALDEATIDAEFLFRFEPIWCEWVSRIRRMMRAMMGQTGDGPLSVEGGAAYRGHLKSNSGLRISIDGTTHKVETDRGGYVCFNEELGKALGEVPFPGDKAEFERLMWQIWIEANQTLNVKNELWRLARAYNLVPPKHKLDEYAPAEVERQFQSVVNWVIWGEVLPSFPASWEAVVLLESKTDEDVRRTIRPWPHSKRGGHWRENEDGSRTWIEDDPDPPKRMMKEVRVRTWAIYYLTRRGGGRRTEQQAVDLWNDQFPAYEVQWRNYKSERGRLFSRGTKKGIR